MFAFSFGIASTTRRTPSPSARHSLSAIGERYFLRLYCREKSASCLKSFPSRPATSEDPFMFVVKPLLVLLGSLGNAATDSLLLAHQGQTEYRIVLGLDASPAEKHAAKELATFLKRITRADFPVVEAKDRESVGEHVILVGPGASEGIISSAAIESLAAEGYIHRSKGATLAIAGGRPRGTLYGVYSFLEDELGCRWFTPEVSRIPERATLAVPVVDRRFVPRLEYRSTDYPHSRDGDFAARNKLNGTHGHLDERHGGKISYGAFVHTFNAILDPNEHFDSHPEYFSEIGGKRIREQTQLCVTNPDVEKLVIQRVREWIRDRPNDTLFSVSQNDWFNCCACGKCSEIAKEEGARVGPYLRLVNAVADAIREDHPDKVVDTLAYQYTRKPPLKTAPRPNVIVRLCSIECCFSHPLSKVSADDRLNEAFAKDLVAWSDKTNRLYIWDYVIDYAHCLLPFPNLWTIPENIRFFADHGVKGIYEEANYFTKGGEFAELRTWIIAKTLWNPDYDTHRAIDEFLAAYYEESAGAIRQYIDLLHERTKNQNLHFRIFDGPFHPLFTDDFLEEAESILAAAEQTAVSKPVILERVQVAKLPVQYIRIMKQRADRSTLKSPDKREEARQKLESFHAVAQRTGITHVGERRSYAEWLDATRKAFAEP